MSDDCFGDIRKILPEEISDGMIREILSDVEKIKEATLKDPANGNFRALAQKYLETKRQITMAQRRERAHNLLQQKRRVLFYTQEAFKGNPAEALQAKLGGTSQLAKGGNDSVANRAGAMRTSQLNALDRGLEKTGTHEIMAKGLIEKEVMIELHELRPGGEVGKSGSKEAVEVAKVLRTVQMMQLDDLRRGGAAVGEIPGYIMRQSHDRAKLHEAGFEKWKEQILPLLDREKTFEGRHLDEKYVNDFLKNAYGDILTGSSERATGTEISDTFITTGDRVKTGNQVSKSRSLHFADGESFFHYNEQFGTKSVLDAVTSSIDRNSRNAALMEVYGTDPQAAFEADFKRMEMHYRDDPKAIEGLKSNEAKIRSLFDEASGLTSIPGVSLKAKIGRNIRTLNNLSKLGNAGVRSIANLSFGASAIKSANGKNILQAHFDLFHSWLQSIPSGARVENARRLGLFINDAMADIHSKFSEGEGGPGKLAKAQRLFFKLNGLNFITSSFKTAIARQLSMDLHGVSHLEFGHLTDRTRANLERFNLGEPEWKLMQKAQEEFHDGNKGITPEKVAELSDADVKAAMPEGSKKPLKDFKRDTQLKLISYLSDHADIGTSSPGIRERNFALRGTNEDDTMGQIARLVWQFKSFGLNVHTILGRFAMSDPAKPARSLGDVIPRYALGEGKGLERLKNGSFQGPKGDIQTMAEFMVSASALGYLADSAIRFSQSKPVKDPTHPQTWLDSFVKGGSGGLYADFLFGEYDTSFRSILRDASGPTIGQADDVGKIWAKAWRGEKVKSDLLRLTHNNIPGQNLFYAKGTLDHFIFNEIQESLTPGWKLKQRQRERKERNQ